MKKWSTILVLIVGLAIFGLLRLSTEEKTSSDTKTPPEIRESKAAPEDEAESSFDTATDKVSDEPRTEYADANRFNVKGAIVSTDGLHISRAQVVISTSSFNSTEDPISVEFQSDDSGKFDHLVEKDPTWGRLIFRVLVVADEYIPRVFYFREQDLEHPVTLTLEKSGLVVQGIVVTSRLDPVVGARVTASMVQALPAPRHIRKQFPKLPKIWSSSFPRSIGSCTTDASGAYQLGGIAPGEWRITATSEDGFTVTRVVLVSVKPGATINLLYPTPIARVEGVLLGPQGNPIANETVHIPDGELPGEDRYDFVDRRGVERNAQGDWVVASNGASRLEFYEYSNGHPRSVTTDASGRFVFEGLPFETATFSIPMSSDFYLPPTYYPLNPSAPTILTLRAVKRGKIEGVLIDSLTGGPPEVSDSGGNLVIDTWLDGSPAMVAGYIVGPDGTFSISTKVKSAVTLKVRHNSPNPRWEAQEFGPFQPGERKIVLKLTPKSVTTFGGKIVRAGSSSPFELLPDEELILELVGVGPGDRGRLAKFVVGKGGEFALNTGYQGKIKIVVQHALPDEEEYRVQEFGPYSPTESNIEIKVPSAR